MNVDIGEKHAASKKSDTNAVNLSQSKAINAIRVATLSGVLCVRTKGARRAADRGPRDREIVLNSVKQR